MRVVFGLTGMPADKDLREIQTAQLSTVFRQMPIALAVNAVNAGITALVLHSLGAAVLPLAWLCIVWLVTAGRWVLWRQYRRRRTESARGPPWSLLVTCGSLLAGLSWGLGGVIMFTVIPTAGQVFLTLVIGGMCAGAVVVSATHLPSLLAFLLSASLPMAVLLFYEGSAIGGALSAMVLVFAAALSLAGGQLSRFFIETMRLRFELRDANLRLRAEIAEHQATEAALRQAQKLEAIGQLTGGIAHDFNNLLTVVIGNLMLAIGRAGENSRDLHLLQGALHAADRGVELIQRLLAFARKQHLDAQSVDVRSLVGSLDDLLRRTLGAQIQLVIEAATDLGPAHVDSNQLELAILNLAINARDAMPSGGTLRIGLYPRPAGHGAPAELPPGDYIVISISDTGTGMDEATLARAFDPFFTTKEIGSGSGLGLPMVQGFAAQSGGAVQIRSQLGQGTTVDLWLPAEDGLHSEIRADLASLGYRGAGGT
jgi:signal transduction histidine kinase